MVQSKSISNLREAVPTYIEPTHLTFSIEELRKADLLTTDNKLRVPFAISKKAVQQQSALDALDSTLYKKREQFGTTATESSAAQVANETHSVKVTQVPANADTNPAAADVTTPRQQIDPSAEPKMASV